MEVSVVVPLFNKVRHIRRALDSVLAQTYQDYEIIVVDDGSTDDGADVVRQVNDPRIRLISKVNGGVSSARNRGIEEAKSDQIAFLDADDEWMPNHLETVMALRSAYPEAGLYATAYITCHEGRTSSHAFAYCVQAPQGGLLVDYFQSAMGRGPVWTSAAMVPKRVLIEVGLFPVGVSRGEDLCTWIKIAFRYRIAWSPIESACYHLSADNRLCNQNAISEDVPMAFVIEDFLRSGVEPISSRSMVEEYLVFWRLRLVLASHLQGKKRNSNALLEKTKLTRMFKKKRLIHKLFIQIPPTLLMRAMSWRRMLLQRFSATSLVIQRQQSQRQVRVPE